MAEEEVDVEGGLLSAGKRRWRGIHEDKRGGGGRMSVVGVRRG